MQPKIWGPPLWQALVACAYHCPPEDREDFWTLLTHHVPLALPCGKCREHAASTLPSLRRHRLRGAAPPALEAVAWVWYLHDRVNRTLGRVSIDREDLEERLAYHDGLLDEVALADVLVMMAVDAQYRRVEDVYAAFCEALLPLLPLPSDSQLRARIAPVSRPIVAHAVRAARAARAERGLRLRDAAHYRRFCR